MCRPRPGIGLRVRVSSRSSRPNGKWSFGQPVIVRLDVEGTEIWRARCSGRAEEVVLLGVRDGTHVFAGATADRQIVVFDEHGTLLDTARIEAERDARYYIYKLSGGSLGNSEWRLTLDTSVGAFLFEVDLDAG